MPPLPCGSRLAVAELNRLIDRRLAERRGSTDTGYLAQPYYPDPPALPAGVYDRKLSRSLEPQGARLLYCAGRLAETLRGLELPDERIALTAAFASIVPQPAVQEGEQPGGGLCQAKSPGRLRAENGTGRHGRSGAAERIQRAFSRCSNWHCI